jgi:hypothetical protein
MVWQDTKLPDWFIPFVTEHEIVALMHSLFPAYLNGCRCLGGHLYVDIEEQNRQMMLQLQDQNKVRGLHSPLPLPSREARLACPSLQLTPRPLPL